MLNKLKNCWKSWTIWLNSIAVAIAAGLPAAQEAFPQLQSYVSGDLYKHLMVVLIAGNILLRFKTSKPLEQR